MKNIEAKEDDYFETKNVKIMNFMGHGFKEIDYSSRGFCFNYEIRDYFQNGERFRDLNMSDEELYILMKYAGQTAGMEEGKELEEMKIRHSFLLVQIE